MIETQSNSSLARKYRSFMTDVLGPLQLDVLDLIAKNEAYLQNNEFDHLFDLLVDYVLMASSYKLIFARWKMNDFTIQFSSRRYCI